MTGNQRIALLVATVLAAAGLFLLVRPEDDEPDGSASTATAPTAREDRTAPPEQPESEEPEVVTVDVEGGEPVGGVQEIRVSKGDRVRLEVAVDEAAQIHVHGYDLLRDATPERPAELGFRATIEGVFEIEVEGTHTQIAELRVEP